MTRELKNSKEIGEAIVEASVATSALSNPSAATSVASAWKSAKDFSSARFLFGGTDAADETVNYQIILWYDVGDDKDYAPVIAAKGTFTLGATTLPVNIEAANGFFADTITDTIIQTGTIIRSPADDSIASIDIDLRNAKFVLVETDLGTAAAADVIMILGEHFGAMADIDVGGIVAEVNTDDIETRFGTNGDAASAIGSNAAQLRQIAENTLPLIAPVDSVHQPLTKPVAVAGTGVPFADDGTFALKFGITAKKAGGDNVGVVFVGDATVDKDAQQGIPLAPGDYMEWEASEGKKFDLNDWYVDADNVGDGINGVYVPA